MFKFPVNTIKIVQNYSNPTENFGSGDLYISTVGLPTVEIYRTYLAFKVNGLPGDAIITRVELGITVKSISDEIDSTGVKTGIAETLPFKEDTITWNDNPEYSTWGLHVLRVVYINEAKYWTFPFYNEDSSKKEGDLRPIKHNITGNGNYYFSLTAMSVNQQGTSVDSIKINRSLLRRVPGRYTSR